MCCTMTNYDRTMAINAAGGGTIARTLTARQYKTGNANIFRRDGFATTGIIEIYDI